MKEFTNRYYVPVLNLNGFTNAENKIFVYDKIANNVFETTVENLSYEDIFTGSDIVKPDYLHSQYFERLNTYIESEFGPFFSDFFTRITSTDTYHISNEEKETFAAYMALQIERTITFTGNLDNKGISDVQLKEMGYDFRNLDTEEALLDCFVKGKKKRVSFSEIINNYIWFLIVNETDIPFYTSDNPIVIKDNYSNTYMINSETTSKGVGIIFPLNSTYLLSIREKGFFDDHEFLENNILHCLKEDAIRFYNTLEIMSSHRYVYSPDNEFKIIAELKQKHPEHFGTPSR